MGNLWFGADSLLLFKYDGANWSKYDLSETITSNFISSLDVDSKGNIWTGLGFFSSERGLIKFDGVNITRYGPSQGFPSDREVFDLKIDDNNSIWVADWDGLIKLNNDPTINIETMVGIDTLRSLTNVNIQWNNYFSGNVKIEYSINNGSTWNIAAFSVSAQDHNYSWNVPIVAPISSECKVRVSDVNNSTNKVESGSLTIYAKVETPRFYPNGGLKNNSTLIYISCPTDGADIYYTTDGSEPTLSSKKCDGIIGINKSTTVKAKAFKSDWIDSDIKTANYTLKVAPITFSPSPATYTYAQYVTLSSSTMSYSSEDTVIIHYTLDGSEPNQQSPSYNQPIYINNNTLIRAIGYRNNFESSEVTTGNYIFSGSNVKAVIKCDSVWVDSDFNGYEEKTVDGSESSITNDTFHYYGLVSKWRFCSKWYQSQILKLKTGTNEIVLIAVGYKGEKSRDTVNVNVYSAKLKTAGSIYSAPAELNNNFFVTSTDDKVYQFDSSSTVNWNILTGGSIQSTTCISNQNNIYVGSTDTRLYSFDQNGVPKWDKAMGGIITSSPSAGKDGVVYVGISTGRLYALDDLGSIKWNVQTGGAIVSSPSVSLNEDVYVGSCDKKLYSVDKDGNVNWTFTTGDSIYSSPAIGNDSSIVFGSNDGYLYKLSSQGNKLWSYYAGGKIKSSSIILNNGVIILGDSNDEIVSLDKDGNVMWKYKTSAPVYGTAAISKGGQILIGDDDGMLYSLNPLGNLNWNFQTYSPIEAPILITDNGLAMFGNLNGEVYTLKLNNEGLNKSVQSINEWPTFKGNNKRTGNKNEVLTGISNENSNKITEYKLAQNYPNPFNPSTTIKYQIPKESFVTVKVYDVIGREAATLVNKQQGAGFYNLNFNASNLSSGIYFYRITAGDYTSVKKMLLLK